LKKKEVKATCFEKLKGYFGFGTLLYCQNIGSVFLIPIPSRWSFKCQVIFTQIIISLVAYVLYFSFRYGGLSLSYEIMKQYSIANFDNMQFMMLS
jgi:hypothetical protein